MSTAIGTGIGSVFVQNRTEKKAIISFDYNSSTRTQFKISLYGNDQIRIDWGDNSQSLYTLSAVRTDIIHNYIGVTSIKTITIYKVDKITGIETLYSAIPSEAYRYSIYLNQFVNIERVVIETVYTTLIGNISSLYRIIYLRNTGLGVLDASLVFLNKIEYLYCQLNIIGGKISDLEKVKYLSITNNSGISGNFSNLLDLEYLYISGTSNLSVNFDNLTKLYSLSVPSNCLCSGTLTSTTLTYFYSFNSLNTCNVDITNCNLLTNIVLRGNGSVIGNISNCTALLVVNSNNIDTTGNLSLAINLNSFTIWNASTFVIDTVATNTKLMNIRNPQLYTAIQVNQILADFWTNRNVNKSDSYTRIIVLTGLTGSSAPTGQGIIDKANLAAYQSPPGTTFWTILTR